MAVSKELARYTSEWRYSYATTAIMSAFTGMRED